MSNATREAVRAESFPCDGPAELDVRLAAARVEVRAADAPHVRVEVSAEPGPAGGREHGPEDVLESPPRAVSQPSVGDAHLAAETHVAFDEQGRKLTVRGRRTLRRVVLDVVVEAPRGSTLKVRAERGSISASGALGGLSASTGSGRIGAEKVEGDVAVATGRGDVQLGRVAGRVRVRTGSGEIAIESIEGEGGKVATGNGDVSLGAVAGDVHVRTGRGSIAVGEAISGLLSVATGSGDLCIGLRPGVAAELDILSGWGSVSSDLDVRDGQPREAPALRVRARTGHGDVVVRRSAV
jgi:DUF4097 and DUF4098 domain-containing protein YvlB